MDANRLADIITNNKYVNSSAILYNNGFLLSEKKNLVHILQQENH